MLKFISCERFQNENRERSFTVEETEAPLSEFPPFMGRMTSTQVGENMDIPDTEDQMEHYANFNENRIFAQQGQQAVQRRKVRCLGCGESIQVDTVDPTCPHCGPLTEPNN